MRSKALLLGFIATFLWSSSYILNQFAFAEGIGPFSLAGLRYLIAASVFVFFSWRSSGGTRDSKEDPDRDSPPGVRPWEFVILGIAGYLVAQGMQYAGQYFISPTKTNMILSIGNNLLVLAIDIFWLRESRGRIALPGVLGVTAGILLYFYPWDFQAQDLLGISFVVISSLGYAVHLTLTRFFLKNRSVRAGDLVRWPMLVGAFCMLFLGFVLEGPPDLSLQLVLILLWLGSINGTLAFYLWTWSQKFLKAYESSILNNMVLVQVAFMDVLILSNSVSLLGALGLLVTFLSVLYVQLAPRWRTGSSRSEN